MRLLICGGTGRAGRALAVRAVAAGHDVRVLSRSGAGSPVSGARVVTGDTVSGAGLAAATAEVDAVVDATNLATVSYRRASRFFTIGTRQLVAAERSAGVSHHVVLSIVGVDRFPGSYYRAKVDQERAATEACAEAGMTSTVARVTQFHDFAAMASAAHLGPLVAVPPLHLRPVHLDDVAHHLLGVLDRREPGRAPELSGPQPEDLPDMVARYARRLGRPVRIVRLPLPGGYGRANTARVLAGGDQHGTLTFEHWLEEQPRSVR